MSPRLATSLRRRGLPAALAMAFTSAFLLSGCGTPTMTAAPVAATSAPAEGALTGDGVMALFNAWNDSLATGDPVKVDAQYAEDAVLLPTLAAGVLDTRPARRAYFTGFLKLKPHGTWVESHTRILSPTAAVIAGLYDFAVTQNGKPAIVHARGSFVFERQPDGVWKIVQHHSSKVPVAEKK